MSSRNTRIRRAVHAAGKPVTAAVIAVATGLGVIEVFRRLHVLERAGRVRCSGGGKGEPLYWTAATPRPATTGLHPPG